ncbi:MAG: transcriptional repressor [Clostridiales bacterium]|nr:transcriptional repressor [Clostridiales bacterium]MDY5515955.1 transcriptional repressor [Candidatus Ventricola sp.]
MMKRNTIQRTLVLEAVNQLKSHATAEEIYEAIAVSHPTVSRATVYRNLNQLAESGEIRKMAIPGGPDRYDHRCHNHYHAMCRKCRRVFDIEMPYIDDLEKSVEDAHGFAISGHDIMFRGLCPECQRKDASGDRQA